MAVRKSDTCIEKISQLLEEMDARGDIVVTTSLPRDLSVEIYSSIVKCWMVEESDYDEPIEFTLPYLLEEIVGAIKCLFDLSDEKSKNIVNEYHKKWLNHRTKKEVAELYAHQGRHDIALRAYYTEVMGKDDHGMDYLDWRKSYKYECT